MYVCMCVYMYVCMQICTCACDACCIRKQSSQAVTVTLSKHFISRQQVSHVVEVTCNRRLKIQSVRCSSGCNLKCSDSDLTKNGSKKKFVVGFGLCGRNVF
jgi:hypothetical protein